jgi:signal transduction histidine kinase
MSPDNADGRNSGSRPPGARTGELRRFVRPTERPKRPRELEASLWRALAAFRILAIIPSVAFCVISFKDLKSGLSAAAALAIMIAWTVAATVLTSQRGSRRIIASGDLAVAIVTCLMSALAGGYPYQLSQPITGLWAGTAGIAWALSDGAVVGIVAVAVNLLPNIVIRGGLTFGMLESSILYLLAAGVAGYAVGLVREVERTFAEGVRLQAATAERERLAREVHDGVLQVLALMTRKSDDRQLAKLAAEQESALRKLIQSRPAPTGEPTGEADLKELLADRVQQPTVQFSSPAPPVMLPAPVAEQVAAAVGAALDNVRTHVGEDAPAWVLVEDTGAEVVVTVRDDGPGIPDGRLAAAAAAGRLGVSQAIRGRIADVGGTVEIVSAPGEGTEVEIIVPK